MQTCWPVPDALNRQGELFGEELTDSSGSAINADRHPG
jgi:hypothetical protein